jgi:hypothetical protein
VTVPASSGDTPGDLALRDATGSFAANTISVEGNLILPAPSGTTSGAILEGAAEAPVFYDDLAHSNVFVGVGAAVPVTPSSSSMPATGVQNVALGGGALSSLTSGSGNTGVGASALATGASASDDTAVGINALGSGAAGADNTAVGADALQQDTAGTDNVAVGLISMMGNTTGSYNTVIGDGAMSGSNTADYNVGVGFAVLVDNTSGGYNTALGARSLATNASGADNVAVGDLALESNTTGSSNIAVGSSAGSNIATGSNNIDIGNTAPADESGVIRLGTNGTQTSTYIAGIAGTTAASGSAVYVDSNGRLGTMPSSARYKDDVGDIGEASRVLMALHPVKFRYKPQVDPAGTQQYGLIAEEVAERAPDLVIYDESGKPQAVRYNLVNAMLLNEVQRQQHQIAALTERLDAIERRERSGATR